MSDTTTDKPLASPGLVSWRYRGRYGFVMIGAKTRAGALREAARSIAGMATVDRLEVWDGARYVDAGTSFIGLKRGLESECAGCDGQLQPCGAANCAERGADA